mgnify:CR=1 FL=1
MPPKVVIRCDAAPAIGYGHVVRCLALADALRYGHGCEVSFAMLQGPEGFEQVRDNGYDVHYPRPGPATLGEGEWLQELLANHQQQVLILDVRTDLATSAVQSIRATGVLIVTIDDPSDRRLLADLAFYPPVPQVGRLDWTGFTGQRFVGWDWVLLRPQFAKHAQRTRAREADSMAGPPSTNRRLTLLVTMGGSDPAGLTLMALDAVERIDSDFRTLVVIGSAFMHDAALADWLASAKRAYQFCRDVADMASLMAEADLAVSSFGGTAYELAAMGVPAIYLCLSHDHAESCAAFVAKKMAVSFGEYPDVKAAELTKEIGSLLMNSQKRVAMSERNTRLVDGKGIERVAEQIRNSIIAAV